MSNLNFQLRQTYSFDVYPVPILGNNFKNVTILAIMDKDSAVKENFDPDAAHVAVLPYLPDPKPQSANGYDYIKIKTTAGIVTVLGIAWIKPETIELISAATITVKITNVTANDIPRIKNALAQNGYTATDLSIS